MKVGEDNISLWLGGDKIHKAYLGSELVHGPEFLQWVGTSDVMKPQRFELNLRWLSTMTFNLDADLTQETWLPMINTYNKNGVWHDNWGADNNRWEVIRSDDNNYEFLYFRTTSGNKNIGDNTGRHIIEFNGGFVADGTRITTVSNPQSCEQNYVLSIMSPKFYGFRVWNNGELIVNLVPARYDGEYGLWDAVGGEFYQALRNVSYLTGGPAADNEMSLLMSRSFIADNPTILYNGYERWTYRGGLLLRGMLGVYDAYSNDKDVSDLLAYAKKYYHDCVNSGGIVGGAWGSYAKSNYDSDQVQAGYNLFRLKQLDSDQAYAANGGYYDNVITTLVDQLADQPRLVEPTSVSGTAGHPFQHKANYAYQHWLDGDFMVEPFRALYAHDRLSGQSQADMYDDIVEQLINAAEITRDTSTQLYRHAYAGQGSSASWSENGANTPGRAMFAWGRALGWYILAINEVLDIIPSSHNPTRRNDLIGILSGLLTRLLTYRDTSGVWPLLPTLAVDTTNNKLEATSSCMYAYGYLHGVRMGYLSADMRDTALSVYQAVVRNFVTVNGASVTLANCVTGGNPGASSTTEADVLNNYYGKGWADNDEHGVGPFIMASLEYELLTTATT